MEVVYIFAPCLLSIQYENEEVDEFERIFDLWQDIKYLEDFFEKHKQDLQSGFYGSITVGEAVLHTRNEAKWLQKQLLRLSQQSEKEQNNGLETLFRPLNNSEHRTIQLGKNKAYGNRYQSWLRIYAIKVAFNTFVVTGGAIKLTRAMNERPHTEQELRKLERCRDYLREEGLLDEESFKELEK